jgi:AraC family transcriptional regulator, melibiose operon regulatory protein
MTKQFDSTRPEFSPYGFTCEIWTPSRMPRPDKHNEIELNFLTSGSITYLLGGHRITVGAGRLAAFWAAIPHQIVEVDGEKPYIVVTFPLGEFLAIGLPTAFVSRLLHGELVIDGQQEESDRWQLQKWEAVLRNRDPIGERAIHLEVQARLLLLSRAVSGSQPVRHPSPSLSRADALACFIARHYQEPLTAESIASAHQLHPNYAMNLFRQAFGTTINTFITQHRITHAQRLLVSTSDSILDVALSSGFQSISRFNEAFKSACGASPRDYRKFHRGEPAAPSRHKRGQAPAWEKAASVAIPGGPRAGGFLRQD